MAPTFQSKAEKARLAKEALMSDPARAALLALADEVGDLEREDAEFDDRVRESAAYEEGRRAALAEVQAETPAPAPPAEDTPEPTPSDLRVALEEMNAGIREAVARYGEDSETVRRLRRAKAEAGYALAKATVHQDQDVAQSLVREGKLTKAREQVKAETQRQAEQGMARIEALKSDYRTKAADINFKGGDYLAKAKRYIESEEKKLRKWAETRTPEALEADAQERAASAMNEVEERVDRLTKWGGRDVADTGIPQDLRARIEAAESGDGMLSPADIKELRHWDADRALKLVRANRVDLNRTGFVRDE